LKEKNERIAKAWWFTNIKSCFSVGKPHRIHKWKYLIWI